MIRAGRLKTYEIGGHRLVSRLEVAGLRQGRVIQPQDRPNEAERFISAFEYVVETQRTRGGKSREGEDTRPYRFGEFDILVVAMQASSHDWNHFLYTVGNWLIPRPDDERLLSKFQPVPQGPNQDWTVDFITCVSWFRSPLKKTIRGRVVDEGAEGESPVTKS